MTAKHPVPPAGGSILMETEHGLSVWRPQKSLETSVLPAESLDEFMRLLESHGNRSRRRPENRPPGAH
jgi:hypothetical protein